MIEVGAAISIATGAFNAIKAGFAAGRDIEGMSKDLGRWMGAVSDIKKAEEYTKKPPLFKKLFAAGSVEEEAMQVFMAKKKAEDMRNQLRQLITLTKQKQIFERKDKKQYMINKNTEEKL